MDRTFGWTGAPGPAVLRLPDQPIRAGIVTLHGASDGRARQPLFDHLASILSPLGVAVLSYDRRPPVVGRETSLRVQGEDAVKAIHAMSTQLQHPVGIFGFSQGAWAASVAAADPIASFLIVLGCSGVSPAEQMRFYTDELLRRHGYDIRDRERLAELRTSYETYLRQPIGGRGPRDRISTQLRAAVAEPWFEHAHLPATVPNRDRGWSDMDFDPAPTFDEIDCPVLAVWGSDEECVPLRASIHTWRASAATVTIADLPGCGHWPAIGSGDPGHSSEDQDQLSADLNSVIIGWLAEQLSR